MNKFENLSREELLKELEKRELQNKVGIVWNREREPEKVVLDCEKIYRF
jgi:hypothetical protein